MIGGVAILNNVTILLWDQYLATNENHGAHITYSDKEVTYSAPFLPPGTDIYSWKSEMSFQNHRMQGQLPLLKEGIEYQILTDLSVVPENSVFFKIEIFGTDDLLIDEQYLTLRGGVFRYPKNAKSYFLRLITTTSKVVQFRWIALGEKNIFDNFDVSLNDKRSVVKLSTKKAQKLDIYIGHGSDTSWLVPVNYTHTQIFFRINLKLLKTEKLVEELTNKICVALNSNDVYKKLKIDIRSFGYPLPGLVEEVRKTLKNRGFDIDKG